MTVATSNIKLFTWNEIIEEAFDIIGVGSEGEAISADMYRRGTRSLLLMVQAWNAMDDLWRREQRTVPMVAGQAAYVIDDPKPTRVTAARRKGPGGYEIQMTPWSRQQYLDQPNKTQSPSTPVNWYYDSQRDQGVLYVWPAPSAQVAPTITVIIDTLRPFFLMDNSASTLDFPAEWQETVVLNLAKRLKLKYPVNDPAVSLRIDAEADASFARLSSWDEERSSLYLQPEDRWGDWR